MLSPGPAPEIRPPRQAYRQRAEPLAADLRGGDEARRIGFLKLVAGMLGVGLDELVQRETTRRQRRLAIVAAASLGGMAVTSTLAVAAIEARDAAREERRQAEGLVAYMVGDLKDKLEPIGRLDALDGVASRVLAYYSKQDTSQLSDAALLQRSRWGASAQVAYLRGRSSTGAGPLSTGGGGGRRGGAPSTIRSVCSTDSERLLAQGNSLALGVRRTRQSSRTGSTSDWLISWLRWSRTTSNGVWRVYTGRERGFRLTTSASTRRRCSSFRVHWCQCTTGGTRSRQCDKPEDRKAPRLVADAERALRVIWIRPLRCAVRKSPYSIRRSLALRQTSSCGRT